MMKKLLYRSVLFLFIFSQATIIYLYTVPKFTSKLDTATLTSASATLSNSRLSFYGKVNGAHTAGDTTIAIDTSGNADNDTDHLFPNDTVSVGPNGGMTVGAIITAVDGSNFVLTSGLTVGASDQDAIYSTQSGALTVTFTITDDIPANGYVRVLIPDPASNGNDGAPDTNSAVSTNGFDLNGMATTDIATTGGTGCTWSTETLTAGSGSGHQYKVLTTTACTAGAITVTFDGATKDLINPAPITSGHTQGTADIYTIDVDTYDGDPDSSGQLIDTIDIDIAPIEAVLVSATVDETLTFAIGAVNSGVTACNVVTDVTTTATSVPWGTFAATGTFYDAAQDLQVSTNADGGYSVTAVANDQIGKDGVTCANSGAEDETVNCIKDTACDGSTCTHVSTLTDDWETASNNGFGYSLDSNDGNDAKWEWDSTNGTCDGTGDDFCAAQFADAENTQAAQTVMTNTGPVDSKNVYVCYRISVSATQPAGYYFNKLKYTATATF